MMRKLMLSTLAVALAAGMYVTTFAAEKSASAEKKAGASAGLKIGDAAPNFTLKDQDGKDVNLADLKGKIVVIEWLNPGCPFVVRHYKEKTFQNMYDKYVAKDVAYLAIQSGSGTTPEKLKGYGEKQGIKYKLLSDTDAQVARAFGAKTTPHMFIIDKEGKLAYKGAIDDDPQGNKPQRTNYVAKALDELLAGQSVSTPETKSYGCGVKLK